FSDATLPGNTAKEKKENVLALSALGNIAFKYHQKIVALAKFFEYTPEGRCINVEHMQTIATKGVEIVNNMMSYKGRLFPIERDDQTCIDDKLNCNKAANLSSVTPVVETTLKTYTRGEQSKAVSLPMTLM
ncbi:MAG TPA: hypothetical protein VHD33_02905, partial [Legionellaceae bacterium]|nr:hypothetical protein [Legionellaceae bacterium]